VHGDVIRFIAFDFILGFILTGVMRVPLVIDTLYMDLDNLATDISGLGIPANLIANFEAFSHLVSLAQRQDDPGSTEKV
jgi:hypothetical protein